MNVLFYNSNIPELSLHRKVFRIDLNGNQLFMQMRPLCSFVPTFYCDCQMSNTYVGSGVGSIREMTL